MKLKRAEKTVRQMTIDTALLRAGFGAMLIVNAFLGFLHATRDESVILVPPFQHETIAFINGRANREFYNQWAWSVSMLAGNISPGNAAFVRGEFQRIATPRLYRKILDALDVELTNITRDNAVVTFSPREVTFDPELNRFFVTGRQVVSGPGVRTGTQKQVTYETGFVTERLRVYLDYFDVYEGRPMTASIRERELRKREIRAQLDAEEETGGQ